MSQAKIVQNLDELGTKYAGPPKQVWEEEIAVAHSMRDMLSYYLNNKESSRIDLGAMDNIVG